MPRRDPTPAVVPAARERTAPEVPSGDETQPPGSRPPDPRLSGSTGGGFKRKGPPLQKVREFLRRGGRRFSVIWRTVIVRRVTRARRAVNRKNVRAAIATIVLAALGVAVVLELDPADEIAGYGFAFLSGILGLAVVRDVLKAGELDLDFAAAVSCFGALALYQLL